jgi:BirA family biotin operon repressor/biotin-[acetyl-CoA-carboxylase] ligase
MTPREEWQLDTRHLGKRVLVFDELPSTNSYAAMLAHDPEQHGVAVLAEQQTAGRGQHGRTWQCPAGSGVLLSILLFPPRSLRSVALLTAWASVSVCEVIRKTTGLQAKIKWPNDVLLRGKKVCGILIEQGQGTVAGIGLNVNQSQESFDAAELPFAGSLAAATGHDFSTSEVARRLLAELDAEYERLYQGDFASLETCWKWRVGLLGKRVTAECFDGRRDGRLHDMTFAGLHLAENDGKVAVLQPETVQHLYPEGRPYFPLIEPGSA